MLITQVAVVVVKLVSQSFVPKLLVNQSFVSKLAEVKLVTKLLAAAQKIAAIMVKLVTPKLLVTTPVTAQLTTVLLV